MKPFTYKDWHAWDGTVGILLSDESTKTLRQFKDPDDCINWLWMWGEQDTARAMNTHVISEQGEHE